MSGIMLAFLVGFVCGYIVIAHVKARIEKQ